MSYREEGGKAGGPTSRSHILVGWSVGMHGSCVFVSANTPNAMNLLSGKASKKLKGGNKRSWSTSICYNDPGSGSIRPAGHHGEERERHLGAAKDREGLRHCRTPQPRCFCSCRRCYGRSRSCCQSASTAPSHVRMEPGTREGMGCRWISQPKTKRMGELTYAH